MAKTLIANMRKAGKAGIGAAKRRGDRAYYQALRAKVGKNKQPEVAIVVLEG